MRIIKQNLNLFVGNVITSIGWHTEHAIHREDGPAEVWYDGEDYEHHYYVEGRTFFCNEYWEEIHANY